MDCGVRTMARVMGAAITCGILLSLGSPQGARAGHESPFYPSFYPQEILIETLDPAAAAAGWSKARVHAYVGDGLFTGGPPPADAGTAQRLRSFLVLTFDGGRPAGAARDESKDRCAAAGRIVGEFARDTADFVFHPYPVTPYHADYLQHFDLAQQARARLAAGGGDGASGRPLRIRARGPSAQALLPARWRTEKGEWDATLEEIDLNQLATANRISLGGWSEPPWVKQGWFQAHLLLAGGPGDGSARAPADAANQRLMNGEYRDWAERVGLERALVSTLTAGCERLVVGYRVKREYFNAEYSNGVEHLAVDSHSGLESPMFARTIKLKEFPWNGWLRLGVATRPAAAWNPVGGFNDAFGRMLWLAVGDPALLPAPYGANWIANRVSIDSKLPGGTVAVPGDAMRPEPGSGLLQPAGTGRTAPQRLRYSVRLTAFHHGLATSTADVLYPYIFAFRWGTEGSAASGTFDPAVARSTALVRKWLEGFKVIGIEKQVRNFGADLQFSDRVLVVDVYLNFRSGDPWEAAAIAPPWSALPWEVVVLMEEAVRRGIAAFSEPEARRRGVPWLDLVRSPETGKRLAALVDTLRGEAYRPDALKTLVTPAEARERWTALAGFYKQHRHFLVTNGPYRLGSWSSGKVVLPVFRDLSYPLGVGAFDGYAVPLKAYVSKIENRGALAEMQAEVERVSRFQRSYEIVRSALGPASRDADARERPECRYVIVGPDGKVVRAVAAAFDKSGRFILDLKGLTRPGQYNVMTALYVNGNMVGPEIKVFQHRVAGGS